MKEEVTQTVAIHQPNYIPWLGYFFKIWEADVFVFLDDVQYSNKGMHNYHYIKTSQGLFRLKIPVQQSFGDDIRNVKTKDHLNWKANHLKTIETNYKRAKYFDEVFSDYQKVLLREYPDLVSLNIELIAFFCKKLGIKTSFRLSSSLNTESTRQEKIIETCLKLDAKKYCSGKGAKSYQKEEEFTSRGITLEYSSYTPFEYEQLWGSFESNVTILDYFLNCGYDWERVLKHQNQSQK